MVEFIHLQASIALNCYHLSLKVWLSNNGILSDAIMLLIKYCLYLYKAL